MSVGFVETSSVSFWILVICVFSIFFSLARSLSTYWFFFQRISFCFIDFFQFSYFQFHWFLFYYIFYFFQFVYSSFSSFLRWELRLLIWGFLHFKCKHLVIKKNSLLSFGCSPQILMCHTFIFIQSNVLCIFLEISSLLTQLLFRSFLFNVHVLRFSYCVFFFFL